MASINKNVLMTLALGELIDKIGEDHVRIATNWAFYPDQLDAANEFLEGYWSDPTLQECFPGKVGRIVARLQALKERAKIAIAEKKKRDQEASIATREALKELRERRSTNEAAIDPVTAASA